MNSVPAPFPLLSKILLLAVVLVLSAGQERTGAKNITQAPLRAVTPRSALSADEQETIQLFQNATASVVYITSIALGQDIFTFDIHQIPQGTGSGFIWDDQGHVVTNFHVIQSASAAEVTLSDHSTWKAKLVGVAPDKDLAVLKINAPANRLKPIPLGTSIDLKVGQQVFAIGNPFGLDQTLTTGIISALGREIQSVTRRPIQGVIQTDAAINPGNSGGPLLDSAGRLIGVNTAIFSPSGAYAGIGFAVPVDIVNRMVSQIVKFGKVTRPGLGITIAEEQLADQLGISGVLVIDVVPEGAAHTAGLRPTRRDRYGYLDLGDVIVAINSDSVSSANDLFKIIDKYEVGDHLTVTVVRDRKKLTVPLTLKEVD